ncbi:SDR family oxidoreductase [Microbacterium sp. C7(2022)]|uniref:SDR family NAD(P)-dependent oxidoreductase n=1 Tax=Microbacterium sp. C7(2022) TaxID=2992759 RepID=UPI00237A717B|nr:SDR family oxidoreductase [Microbacterium sp. C7(2022)]MDE0545272.1 SDR family oxidoreductase [Microbacterium sp. C7(2022)]
MNESIDGPSGVLSGRTILLAGGTSAAGLAVTEAARRAGATVVVVGRDAEKLTDVVARTGAETARCDLTDESAVAELADDVHRRFGPIDGILYLVGGWRGGGGLAGQSDEDYRFLEQSVTALRHVTRAFDQDLRSSDAARLAIVSSTAVARPLAGGANYAAVKAASEAWTRAVAQGFAKDAREREAPLRAASVIFRVKALAGLENTLAAAFVDLWATDAADLNDSVIDVA